MIKKVLVKWKQLSLTNRNLLVNISNAFIIKGGSLIVSLLTMPAYLKYFNNEIVLGLWFTILSVLNWILNFDLGIGNGLRNHLTTAIAEKNFSNAKKYISSSYISIGVLCALLIGLYCFISPYVNWNIIFNIGEDIVSKKSLNLSVGIVFCGIILQLFLKLITSILYALQKSAVNNLLSLITSIITLIFAFILPSKSNDTNIIVMATVHTIAVLLPLLIVTFIIFLTKPLIKCFPTIHSFDFKISKSILSLGGTFLFVQIMYMVMMSTNEYLITLFNGNEWVTEYQIYYKPFSVGATIFSLAVTPIWSAVTKALAEKKIEWIKRLYKILFLFSFIGSIGVFLIIFVMQPFVNIWLQENSIVINYGYAIVFAFLGMMMIFNSSLASIANGIGKLKTQAVLFCIGALIKIPLSWLLIIIFDSWIGVVLSNVICIAIYCFIQPFTLNKNLNTIEKEV